MMLTGRLAVITGAASGIGRATAIRLAHEGARLILADIDETGLGETAELVRRDGGEACCRVADCADHKQVDALAEFAESVAPLGIWCNVAGIAALCPAVSTDQALYDRILALNLGGTFWACAASALMRARTESPAICSARPPISEMRRVRNFSSSSNAETMWDVAMGVP